MRAHKGWWSEETGYFYAASGEPGFRNVIVQIFDLKNPKEPKLVGRAWLPGLKDGEPGYEGQYSHHPVVDEENKRLYVGYRNAGGQAASFDISNPAQPKLVWSIDMNPPHRGPHTVSPILYREVPNFGKSALPRTYAFIVDEAGGEPDMTPCPNGVRPGSYMLDITTETKPFPVSVWQVPVGNFCEKGGRFGPHQSAETVNGRINRFEDKIAWLAYFNAGVRVVDLSDPYKPERAGVLHPEAESELLSNRGGTTGRDSDERRRHRPSRAGVCLGPRRHGTVHSRIYGREGAMSQSRGGLMCQANSRGFGRPIDREREQRIEACSSDRRGSGRCLGGAGGARRRTGRCLRT